MPMKPNFNSPLDLEHDSTRVDARGPLNWDDDSGHCRIKVIITQTVNGTQVVATGESGNYNDDDLWWDVTARTENDAQQFQPGPADARGEVTLNDTPPPRVWTQPVNLRL